MSQLRIDATRLVKGQPVLEYTHGEGPLPLRPSGTGCAWGSVEDMLAQARVLRDWLAQPEQLVLLQVMAAFNLAAATPTDRAAATSLATLSGKTITATGGTP